VSGDARPDTPLRYLLGTPDGAPAALDLRHEPGLADGFDTGEHLAGLVAKYVATTGLAMPGGFVTPPEMVVLGALPMAFKTHAAIMHLSRLGYREDAEARLRTLFELAVDLRYMLQAHDPQDCAQRWLDYAKVVQHKLWGVLERGGDYYEEIRRQLANRPQEMQQVLEAIDRVKAKETHWYTDSNGKPKLHAHWSGKNTEAIAKEVGWEDAYNTLFRESSEYIHPGVHGFTGYFRFDDPPGWVTIDAAPSAEGVRGVMASSNIYFAHVLRAWAEVLGIDAVLVPLRTWMETVPAGESEAEVSASPDSAGTQ
jgi:hypothetical protein